MDDSAGAASQAPHSGRRTYLLLWLSYAFFILYVTTLPFDFIPSTSRALAKLSAVSPHPFRSADGTRASISDMTQNVVLFAPFGALAMLLWGRRRRGAASIVAAAAAGFALSASVETLQLFTADRVSSLNDVVTDTIGATVGAVAAWFGIAISQRSRATPERARAVHELYPVLVWAAVLVLAAWHPFDTTIDVGSIAGKVRSFVNDPWERGALGDEGVDAVRYALFAAALAYALRRQGVSRPRLLAALAGSLAAAGLEFSQLFIESRMPGMKDVTVGVAGSSIGALLACRPVWSARAAAITVATMAWLGAALMTLSPLVIQAERRPFTIVPFLNYQTERPELAISHAAELSLAFFPIGFALVFVLPRRWRWLSGALIAVVLGGILEYLQGWIVGRYPDVTDVAVLALGAMAGTWAAGHVLTD